MNDQLRNRDYAVVNPCTVCSPLGATLAFKGVEGAMTLIHGSQGCATYMRRYLISHFREPVDVASSSFNETTAVFGGSDNLKRALDSMISQYHPSIIGVATTCLSETIGDDVERTIREYRAAHGPGTLPAIVPVATPAYSGSHEDGFHLAIGALVNAFAAKGGAVGNVVALPPLLSPEDVRFIKSAIEAVALRPVVLPDYSLTLDGESWEEFTAIPPGGVSLDELGSTGLARAALEFGAGAALRPAGNLLSERHGVPVTRLPVPMGIRATDAFFACLTRLSGLSLPAAYSIDRGRLLDAYADGNKYVYGKRVALFGDEDCVAALMLFCAEIGMKPVVVATGRKADRLRDELRSNDGNPMLDEVTVCEDTDFDTIEGLLAGKDLDLCIGTSKGYRSARLHGIPLVRIGFPVHDRFGAARMATCGYRGTLEFFDRVVNTLLEKTQESSPVGYSYL